MIHFVEQGQRSKGVLVAATAGYPNAFSASWVTMLVPIPPTALDGPVWSNEKATREEALAIAALPDCRNEVHLYSITDLGRRRFHQLSVWILSTDPLIVGLPAGDPKRSWRDFEVAETDFKDRDHAFPVTSVTSRFVVEGELDQPLASIVVFPADVWQKASSGNLADMQLTVVTFPTPLPIDIVLNALTDGTPARLGKVEAVSLCEDVASEREQAKSFLADRARLMAQ